RIRVERAVARGIVGGRVGASVSDVVEQDDPVVVFEGGRDEPPHVLIAPEAMREDHRDATAAECPDVVALQYGGRAAHGSNRYTAHAPQPRPGRRGITAASLRVH